ncbi:amidohydrolase family protein [Arthrobacter sp. B3I4]|uniref:amidohydrolase family protein n=1 Tax=Arthrobacter sp. B3I4 TaxID=3042267 RepID=UPI002786CDBE|nr:amidohydrolase family protein [Arthrobacter sp. B3I4]MDQ0756579.1 putative TIM-barrel fold metal-dependent hydrolase [Arthrobacter sp. B3I4]
MTAADSAHSPARRPAVPAPLSDGDVPAWWQRLGLPGVIDVHTHFLPDRMLRRVWAHFDEAGPLVGRPWPITYRTDQDTRLARLREMGVRRFTALTYAHRPGMAADLTDFALTLAAAEPDCVPSATFYPEEGVLQQVQAALDRGARIFKIHAQVGGFDLREPILDPVWGLLAEAGIPVVVHVGSGPVPRPGFTGPDKLEGVLRRHPALTAVVAHLGTPEYREFLALAERYPRVQLDTTMAFTDFFEAVAPFPAALLPRLADLQDRIVLGSDFPNIPYPYAHQLEALERLRDKEPRLDDQWLRAVCWFNGERLVGS